MNITLEQAIDMQRALDQIIHTEKGLLPADTIQNRIIALSVEFSELANELRFFKYWSEKGPSIANACEESADCLHFIISIGLSLGLKVWLPDIPQVMQQKSVSEKYMDLQEGCKSLWLCVETGDRMEARNTYERMLVDFMMVLSRYKITKKDLLYYYYVKNRINHERQENGY